MDLKDLACYYTFLPCIEPMNKGKQKFGIIVKKNENFQEWYIEVVLKSELIDYHNIRGCYIMRPQSMFMWKKIREWFDAKIEGMGVQECYFPMVVNKKDLEQEKGHLENFNPELAWITHCGGKEIDEPMAIRPTSEAIMYPSFRKWLRTYRDLPLKLNQWCSVLRWEVKSTLPFIRGREFLWQEGHTAHYLDTDAKKEVLDILDLYAQLYSELLAVPVIKGRKSRSETFGGAECTFSVEAFIPGTGRGVQGATSHFLGQNFSKIFEIEVETEHEDSEKSLIYQNSWGSTTRLIGIMVMIHSDDKGLVIPPRIAQIQIVIVMCGVKSRTPKGEIETLKRYVVEILEKLSPIYRIHFDDRENVSPGFKYNYWEIKGIPLRIEVGFRDMEKNEMCVVRRDTGEKIQMKKDNMEKEIMEIMNRMHNDMYNRAEKILEDRTKYPDNIDEFCNYINEKCLCVVPWCKKEKCEKDLSIKTTVYDGEKTILMGSKILCLPLSMEDRKDGVCVCCGENKNTVYALFGRSY